MKISLRTAVTALLVTTLVGAGLVGQASSASASTTVHFTASLSGPVKLVLPNRFFFHDLTGTSNVMGTVTANAVATVNGLSLTCVAGMANVNVVTITGSDGSLTLTSNDVGCPSGVITFRGTGVYTVTGGTGRYAGATGSGTLFGGADLLGNTSRINADGTLTLP